MGERLDERAAAGGRPRPGLALPRSRRRCRRCRRFHGLVLSECKLVDASRVVAHQLAQHDGLEVVSMDLVDGALEAQHREVRAEDDLVLSEAVDEFDEGIGPVFGTVRVAADEDVRMLPRHRDHFLGPRNADVDADQAQFRKVAGHAVERDRTAYAARPVLGRIDHRLADLQLVRDVEFDALGIERIVLRVIGREIEPVWVAVRTDEAVVLHGPLQRSHAGHAFKRIDAGQTMEPVGMPLDRTRNEAVGQMITAGQPHASRLRCDQECLLDAGLIHQVDHRFERKAAHDALVGFHLADEEIGAPSRPVRQGLRRPDVHDRVDGLDNLAHACPPSDTCMPAKP